MRQAERLQHQVRLLDAELACRRGVRSRAGGPGQGRHSNYRRPPTTRSSYYSTFIGSPQNIKNQGIGIALAGWGADFPTGVGFFQSITNGNAILPTG